MFALVWDAPALAAVQQLPKAARKAIGYALYRLQRDPSDGDVKKLSGIASAYRLRVGVYRVLYRIDHGKLIITVVKAGHRRDIYDDRS